MAVSTMNCSREDGFLIRVLEDFRYLARSNLFDSFFKKFGNLLEHQPKIATEYGKEILEDLSNIHQNISNQIADYYNIAIEDDLEGQNDLEDMFDTKLKIISGIILGACLLIGLPFHFLFRKYELIEYDSQKRSLYNRIIAQGSLSVISSCFLLVPLFAWRFCIGPLTDGWAYSLFSMAIFSITWNLLTLAEALTVRAANLLYFHYLSGINDVFFSVWLHLSNISYSLGMALVAFMYGQKKIILRMMTGNEKKYLIQDKNPLVQISPMMIISVILISSGIIVMKYVQNRMKINAESARNKINIRDPRESVNSLVLNNTRRNPPILSNLTLVLIGLGVSLITATCIVINQLMESSEKGCHKVYLRMIYFILLQCSSTMIFLPVLVMVTKKKTRKFILGHFF